ncbi:MAG: hypothetical protein KDC27_10165 [Acidobacteria bacterium]|nr:hypothetical protein [Acidobacteriota bacterium]
MQSRSWILSLLVALAAQTGAAQTQWATERLPDVEFRVRLIQEPEQIQAIVGDELDKEFMLVELEVKPLYGSKIHFSREDFLLRTRADNDHSNAQSPSRIAGKGVYSVEQRRTSGGGVFGQSNDPLIIGGAPGTGSRPNRVGGPPTTVGNARGGTSEIIVQQTASEAPETLQDSLARLELPLAETDQDLHGYLYFQLDPKNKLKHIVFYYDGEYGEFQVKFEK